MRRRTISSCPRAAATWRAVLPSCAGQAANSTEASESHEKQGNNGLQQAHQQASTLCPNAFHVPVSRVDRVASVHHLGDCQQIDPRGCEEKVDDGGSAISSRRIQRGPASLQGRGNGGGTARGDARGRRYRTGRSGGATAGAGGRRRGTLDCWGSGAASLDRFQSEGTFAHRTARGYATTEEALLGRNAKNSAQQGSTREGE